MTPVKGRAEPGFGSLRDVRPIKPDVYVTPESQCACYRALPAVVVPVVCLWALMREGAAGLAADVFCHFRNCSNSSAFCSGAVAADFPGSETRVAMTTKNDHHPDLDQDQLLLFGAGVIVLFVFVLMFV